MSAIPKSIQNNELKLLIRILQNVVSNPNNHKYQNLHFGRIYKKFEQHPFYMVMLNDAGFCKSYDGKRLIFDIKQLPKLKKMLNKLLVSSTPIEDLTDTITEIDIIGSLDDSILTPTNNNDVSLLLASSISHCGLSNRRENEYCELDDCKPLENIGTVLNLYDNYIKHAKNGDENVNTYDDIYLKMENNYNNVNLLNDFNHILSYHGDEFEQVHNLLSAVVYELEPCSTISNCLSFTRNQRDRQIIAKNEWQLNNMYFNDDAVSQQLLDRIHCYFFHTFHIGYNITEKDKRNIIENDNDEIKTNSNNDTVGYNHTLAKISNLLRSRRASVMKCHKCNNNINDNKFNTNSDKNRLQLFSYGFRYFYWEYYKNNFAYRDDARRFPDFNHVNQFRKLRNLRDENENMRCSELYISNKYNNFKEEILSNPIQTIAATQWENSAQKASKHVQTDLAREYFCARRETAKYYAMKYRDPITTQHLLSMMLYCNFDTLSFRFSETFRKENKDETCESLKNRHRNYHFFGKLLRECVECFGMQSNSKNMEIKVFHGVNGEFTFSSMNAYIKGPFSVSRDYYVAVNFCNNAGLILELSIQSESWTFALNDGIDAATRIACFDCVWLSDYPNEQEVFCIGGLNPILFKNIINANKGINYSCYMNALKYISFVDYTGSTANVGYRFEGNTFSKNVRQMAFRLLSHELYTYYPKYEKAHQFESCPQYIENILHSHCGEFRSFSMFEKDNKIYKYLFGDENEWIKLNLIATVFPNCRTIQYYATTKDILFLKQTSIYQSILQCTENNQSLKDIVIVINPKFAEEMKQHVAQYREALNKNGFAIGVDTFGTKCFGMDFSSITREIMKMFQGRQLKQLPSLQPYLEKGQRVLDELGINVNMMDIALGSEMCVLAVRRLQRSLF